MGFFFITLQTKSLNKNWFTILECSLEREQEELKLKSHKEGMQTLETQMRILELQSISLPPPPRSPLYLYLSVSFSFFYATTILILQVLQSFRLDEKHNWQQFELNCLNLIS
jgi:hypothetical protein